MAVFDKLPSLVNQAQPSPWIAMPEIPVALNKSVLLRSPSVLRRPRQPIPSALQISFGLHAFTLGHRSGGPGLDALRNPLAGKEAVDVFGALALDIIIDETTGGLHTGLGTKED